MGCSRECTYSARSPIHPYDTGESNPQRLLARFSPNNPVSTPRQIIDPKGRRVPPIPQGYFFLVMWGLFHPGLVSPHLLSVGRLAFGHALAFAPDLGC